MWFHIASVEVAFFPVTEIQKSGFNRFFSSNERKFLGGTVSAPTFQFGAVFSEIIQRPAIGQPVHDVSAERDQDPAYPEAPKILEVNFPSYFPNLEIVSECFIASSKALSLSR